MGKKGKNQKKDNRNPKKRSANEYADPQDMDDEIDAFHKQRDVIPLDADGHAGEFSDDEEEPVFDDKDIYDDEDDDDTFRDTGLAAKIARQKKFLEQKFGKLDDEMNDDDEEEEEEKKDAWDGRPSQYYGADTHDVEESSDDERPEKEEEEAERIQRERAKNLTMQDFGLEDDDGDESDRDLTVEKAADGFGSTFEGFKTDLNALSSEEQIDISSSSGPELVRLVSELNEALEQLESRVHPLLSKVKVCGDVMGGAVRYLEVEQLLLLTYCQAITFYLVLKSEGHSVHDHPVIARLVEIKELLDKMKQLDGNLPPELEELLKEVQESKMGKPPVEKKDVPALAADLARKVHVPSPKPLDKQKGEKPQDTNELMKSEPRKDGSSKDDKRKRKNPDVGVQSAEMLKIRASLEKKLKQNGVFSSFAAKSNKEQKHSKLVNRPFETYDDFNDDAIDVENGTLGSKRLSQLVTAKQKTPKVISGDDDLPKRDDIGERRMKFEMGALARTGVKFEDDAGDELDDEHVDEASDTDEDGDQEEDGNSGDSGDEYYKQVEQQHAAKRAAKAQIYTRTQAVPSLPETVDGKRKINYQIEKNKGLTPSRPKSAKNPRKKYRVKHKKQQQRRKGQVREVRKHTGPYAGEASGINPGISKSIRFKN
ncbi:hypothetical protein Tsubulata_050354 [Turnera subulata]|uniref:Sas10 C-terminal domain-containing protein n=1 Tax=Turnera subulata TaxID=218843 RepID=A0A9Q0FGT1_9ROSI|nr:hypothetical protein Tsubulata_050354 [Turnera subulata]